MYIYIYIYLNNTMMHTCIYAEVRLRIGSCLGPQISEGPKRIKIFFKLLKAM